MISISFKIYIHSKNPSWRVVFTILKERKKIYLKMFGETIYNQILVSKREKS